MLRQIFGRNIPKSTIRRRDIAVNALVGTCVYIPPHSAFVRDRNQLPLWRTGQNPKLPASSYRPLAASWLQKKAKQGVT